MVSSSPRTYVISVVVIVACALASLGCAEGSSSETTALDSDPSVMQPAAASAMGDVESVRFALVRTGEPVFIDSAGTLALDRLEGRFAAPANADALLDVTVLGNLQTQLGAVSLDGKTWLSNPITGVLEPLPDGIDVDPSRFFDPAGAWEPLIANATEVSFVGEVEHNGQSTFEYTGVGQADDVSKVTSNLVRDQDVAFTMWVDPTTALLSGLDFETEVGGARSSWTVSLSEYGAAFAIADPSTTTGG